MKYIFDHPIVATIGTVKYKCTVQWLHGKFIMDEPAKNGGNDLGPDPYTLLLSSLGACTITTLRMYIDRKGWDIPEIKVSVNMYQTVSETLTTTIIRDIHFAASVPTEQKDRLLLIAKKCPVSKILENNIIINTNTAI